MVRCVHRRALLFVGALGLGCIPIGLIGAPALAQSDGVAPGDDLRATIEPTTPEPDGTDQPSGSPNRSVPTPPGRIPKYGQRPSVGAGSTGFVSTNVPRSRRAASGVGPAGLAQIPGIITLPPEVPDPLAPASGAASGAQTPASPPPPGLATGQRPVPPIFGATPTPATAPDTVGLIGPATALPAAKVQALLRRKPAPEEDPFDAVGIRAGSFVLRPAIEVWTGFDSNPARLPDGAGSSLIIVAPELTVRSDWEQHQLTAAIRGSYNDYPAVPLGDRPAVDARIDGRIDASRDTRIDLEGRYILGTDYPGSPNLPAGIAKLPIFDTLGGTVGIGQHFNRLDLSLKGTIDRTVWQPSLLTDGSSDSNLDRNYNQYGGQLRASYELTPGLKPFVELDADTRVHDLAIDRNGFGRNSDGFVSQAGTGFELSRLLTGELSAGYLTRLYRDPNLPDIAGLIANGSLVWTASALTSVKLTARSTADETVLPGVSGLFRRDTEVDVDHAFRRWLIGTVKLGAGLDDYIGSDRQDHRYLASLGLTYKLTRSVQIKGEVREEWLLSSVPGQSFNATVAMVGVRYQ